MPKKEQQKKKWKDMSYEEKLADLDGRILKAEESIKDLRKAINNTKVDIVNLKNEKKALMYDHEHMGK